MKGMKMKKGIWLLILITLQMSLILSSCSNPGAITVTKTVTELPILKTDTPVALTFPAKTATLVKTKTSTPVILYRLTQTLSPLDKKRRYEARISYKQMQMIAIAIDEYYSNKGSYPNSLKDLVPDYLDNVPRTITGQEIRYLKSDVYIYNLIINLAYWDKESLCVYHRDNEEYECG
jgi:hypothetical protein